MCLALRLTAGLSGIVMLVLEATCCKPEAGEFLTFAAVMENSSCPSQQRTVQPGVFGDAVG